jgi:hypothetical protein
MSLSVWSERVEALAAGEENAEAREHVRGCDECRAHYDALRLAARALGDDGAPAERARLTAHLPQRRPWFPIAAAAVALAAGLLVFVMRPAHENVGLRGGGGNTGQPPPFSLRVFAKDAAGEPVHLVADFPGSGEATVGVRAEVQYFVKPAPQSGLALVVETTSGQRAVRARVDGDGSTDYKAVGAAFPAGSLGPGDARVCAVLAASGHGGMEDASIDALKRAGYTASQVYCSTLKVTP